LLFKKVVFSGSVMFGVSEFFGLVRASRFDHGVKDVCEFVRGGGYGGFGAEFCADAAKPVASVGL